MDYEQLSNFFSGELPPDEAASFLALLEADEELREEAIRLKNSWVAAQLTAEQTGDKEIAQKGWERFSERIHTDKAGKEGISNGRDSSKIVIWPFRRVAVAAAVAVILVVASSITGYIINQKSSVTAFHTMTVPAGQSTQLTLPDGSEIWLNACSKLTYPEKFTSKKREIQLEGEGLFKVISDKKKPFVVKTGLMDIIATGTQFNVSAYPDDHWISTTLIEGAVRLQSDKDNSRYDLKSGQIAIFDKQTQRISASDTDTDMQISWIHGEYQFRETALEDLAKRFERYYNLVFVFENESMKQRKFTGTFYNSQSIESVLRVIATSTDMQYSISNHIIYIK
ncbi:MAG: DUF4974 domain-containing protein [Tannerella sp.]|jgi:ferric-dicitrate binding protein FerR (iron transport regulator)|nr:DUF4974 domain-containing protein [Tannerella sp.]